MAGSRQSSISAAVVSFLAKKKLLASPSSLISISCKFTRSWGNFKLKISREQKFCDAKHIKFSSPTELRSRDRRNFTFCFYFFFPSETFQLAILLNIIRLQDLFARKLVKLESLLTWVRGWMRRWSLFQLHAEMVQMRLEMEGGSGPHESFQWHETSSTSKFV
jgi:hypothetical protein